MIAYLLIIHGSISKPNQEYPTSGIDFWPNYGGAFVPPMMSDGPVYSRSRYSSPIYSSGPSYTT